MRASSSSSPRPSPEESPPPIELRFMNMSCSAGFLRLVKDWKVEGAGGRLGGAPRPGPSSSDGEPHMWGAPGRWWETQQRQLEGWESRTRPAVFDVWHQVGLGKPFKGPILRLRLTVATCGECAFMECLLYATTCAEPSLNGSEGQRMVSLGGIR